MRCFVEGSPEEPKKVKTRQAGLLRYLFKIERQVVAFVYQSPSAGQPMECVSRERFTKPRIRLVIHKHFSQPPFQARATRRLCRPVCHQNISRGDIQTGYTLSELRLTPVIYGEIGSSDLSEMLEYSSGLACAHKGLQFVKACFRHSLQTSKVPQQASL